MDSGAEQVETLFPQERVTVAKIIGEKYEAWLGTAPNRKPDSKEIWGDLGKAEIEEKGNQEAEEAYGRVTREVVRAGIISAGELKEIIETAKREFRGR